MLWEHAPSATLVRPPSSYIVSIRQIEAALQQVYQPSPQLQGLIDDLLNRIERSVLPLYQGKLDASEQALLSDLKQEFQVFRVTHMSDVYGDLDSLAKLLGSDFALWAMPLNRISKFWGPSGVLWKYCSGALDLILLYEMRSWWNEQPNVKKISELIYHKASVDQDVRFDFVTVRMVESEVKLPFDSRLLTDFSKKHLENLVQRQKATQGNPPLEQLLRRFPPSSANLPHTTWQQIYAETPKLLLVNVENIVEKIDPSGSIATLLKAVIDWAVYSNVQAAIQQGGWEDNTKTIPPPDPSATQPGKKPRGGFYLGFRAA